MSKKQKKSKVTIEYKRLDDMEKPADIAIMNSKLDKAELSQDKSSKQGAMLISRAEHPITISYGDDMIVISPRERIKVADASLLTLPLPAQVSIIKK